MDKKNVVGGNTDRALSSIHLRYKVSRQDLTAKGLKDACNVDIFKAFQRPQMKKHFMDCVQANGVFLVTTIVLNSVVIPLGRGLLLTGEDTVTQNYLLPALLFLVSLIFYV